MDAQHDTPSQNQVTQQQMIEQAARIPGVAEAMAAYARLAPYTALTTTHAVIKVTYGTGGNREHVVDAQLG